MLYAILKNGIKSRPERGSRAICPDCGGEMIAKCGDINIWHWAHKSGDDCDSWSEGESEWHLGWKLKWPVDNVEIQIIRDGVHHNADILTPKGIVIELQHSPISIETIKEREVFYGEMLWVFDLIQAVEYKRFSFCLIDIGMKTVKFTWSRPRKSIFSIEKPLFLDVGNGQMIKVDKFELADNEGYNYFSNHKYNLSGGTGRIVKTSEFIEEHNFVPKAKQSSLF
jgi:ssDNA-binding Zn-finger/Zn-ribbon topoisomerase 1